MNARRLIVKYKYLPSSIIAIDETSVWNDIVSNTTIDKQRAKFVYFKTIGDEKFMVSVCLAAKVDGTKLKPFVVSVQPKENLNHLIKNSNPVL